MTADGIGQIVFYAVVLIALGVPLGAYMARVSFESAARRAWQSFMAWAMFSSNTRTESADALMFGRRRNGLLRVTISLSSAPARSISRYNTPWAR